MYTIPAEKMAAWSRCCALSILQT